MSKTKSSKHVGHQSHLQNFESLARRPLRNENRSSEESSEEENESNENNPSKILHSTASDEDEDEQNKYCTSSEVHKPTIPKKAMSSYFIYLGIIIIVCGVVGLFLSKCGTQKEVKVVDVDVSQILADMKNHFQQQSGRTYHFIKSQLKKVVNVTFEPPAPAIITLIANKGAEITASKFSQHLADALAPGNYISINDSTYWSNNPDEIRLKIDEEIKSQYHRDQLTVMVVDKLHYIPFEAAMIFHGYCDHEHSPYKKAVFLFIVPLNEVIPENLDNKDLDSVAMISLRKIWHTATDDEVDSLITRMTVAVVHIK